MIWQPILYFSSILLTCILTGFLFWYARRQPALPGVHTFGWMVLSECLLALTEMLSMLGGTQEQALFWFNVRVIFIAIIPVLWLKFALEYNGRKDWFSKQLTAGAFIIPLITQGMLWSNSLHGLWVRQEVAFHQNGLFWIAQTSARVPGIWFMVHSFYSMTLLLAGIGVLLLTAWQKREDYRGQAVLLSVGALISLVTTVIPIFNLLPQAEFNPFVPGIGISVLMYALAIFRFQFLKRTPAQEVTPRRTVLDPHEKNSVAVLIFIFILFATVISAASYFTYQNYKRQFRAQVENQLSAISALKIADLQDWRNERLADARLFYQNENFSERVQAYLEDPQDAETQIKLLTWMEKIKVSPEYDRVFLLDSHGVERLSIPATSEAVPPNLVEQAAASLDSDQIIFLDFHRHSDSDAVHLSILVPIFSAQNNQPLGALVLRINPNVYLYPFIQRWPVPSQSAETLLVRRDGNDIVYLNELKFEEDAALNLRIPLENEDTPAVKAVLGQIGIVTGMDYRGAQVIADVRAVPNSPWFVISKMDTAEVDAPLWARLWQTLLFFGVLILITGSGLLLIWRQQRVRFYRGQVEATEALRASEEKFRLAFDTSPDSVAITRMSDGMFVSVNKGFEQISGYTRDQVIGKTSAEINIWKDLADRRNVVEELQATGKVQNYEASFVTLDGEIYGLMSAVIIEINGEPHILNITRDITERKRADEKLKESNSDLKQSQSVAHLGNWKWNLKTSTVEWSDEMFNIFGIDKDSYSGRLGDVITQVIHPDDLHIVLPENASEFAKNKPQEYRIIRPNDGELRHIWAQAGESILDEQGNPAFLTGIAQDITERKQAEDALRESEQRFRDIMENVNLISAMLDINGNIIFANNYFLKLTGWQLEEVLGRNWFELLIPPEAEVRHVLLESMKEGPVPPYYQNEIFTRNGELRLIDWSNTLLRDAQGNHAGIAGIGVDITERKRAEKALYESEERFRRLAENAQDLIYRYELSPKRGFSYVSPAATTITGYSPEEHYADPDLGFKLVHPDDRQLLAMATQDGGAIRKPLMLRWIRKDGSMLWTEQRNVPIYAEDGTLIAIEGIAIDITERKRAEEALRESETNLSALIENTDASIWAVDQQYGLIVGNGEFHRNTSAALGRRLEMGESVLLPNFPPEVNAEWQGLYDRALQGERFTLETVTHFREEPRYIEYRLSPIREDGGEIRGVTVYGRDITERRKSEKEIRLKDELLHMTSEMAKIGGWEFDALTLEGTWTDEVARIHGLDPAQPTNVQFGTSFYLPDSRRKIEQSIQEAIEFARPYDLEMQIVTTTGEQKWVRTMGLPILADGKVVKIQGIFQDITERKQAEEALRERESLLNKIFDILPVGLWLADKNGNLTRSNEKGREIWGAEPLVGQEQYGVFKARRLPSGEELAPDDWALAHTIREGVTIMDELLEIEAFDGEKKIILNYTAPVLNQAGSVDGAVIINLDISERMRAENELRVALIKYKTLFDCFPQGITVSDEAGNILETNSAAGKLLGVAEEEHTRRGIGGTEWKIIRPDGTPMPPEEFASVRALQEKHIIENVEMGIVKADDAITWISVNATPLPVEGYGVVATYGDISGRKQAEDALIQVNERLALAQRLAGAGVWDWDLATGKLNWTPEFFSLFGLDPTKSDATFDTWRGALHPDDIQGAEQHINEAIRDHVPLFNEYRIVTPSGETRWIGAWGNATYNERGEALRMTGICIDITKRKQAENAMRESEEKFRQAFNTSPIAISIARLKGGGFVSVNKNFEQMSGYSESEIIGKTAEELHLWKSPEIHQGLLKELRDNGEVRDYETPILTRNGEIYCLTSASIIEINGEPHILTLAVDITKRKQAEEALRESEEKFKYVFDNSAIGKSITLPSGEIHVNKAFSDLLGYSMEEVQNKKWQEISHPDDIEATQRIINSLISRERDEARFTKRYLHKNGSVVWADVSTSLRRDKDSKPLYFMTAVSDITERKRAEDALRESEERFKVLHNASFGGITIHDKGKIIECNQGLSEMMGYSRDELLLMDGYLLIAPDSRELVKNNVAANFEKPYEAFGMRKNGEIFPMMLEARSVPYKGKTVRTVEFRDITERKQMEEALRESATFVKTVLNNLPVGVAVNSVEPTVAFNYMNDNFAKFYRTTKEKLSDPDTFWNAAYEEPDFREMMRKRILDDLASGDPERMVWVDIPITRKGEATTFITARNIPIPNQPLMISTVWDVTERKRAEEKLFASEVRYRGLFEATRDGILILDAETSIIVDVNPFLIELLGYSHEVFIGKNIWEIGLFKDIAANKAHFLELQQEQYIRYEDLPLETADGRRVHVEFTSNVYHTDHKKVIQCNIRDLTERKQAQEQLHKTLEELKRSNTELEQFAYIASHDLQEPLRAVAGMVQLLQKRYEGQLDARADEYINLAMDGATRMQTLITDLLAYSRVERRGHPIQPIDANKSLASALRNLQAAIAEQGATITSETLPTLEADASQLTQLFQNLIGNAIKFHGEHPTLIHVSVEKMEDAWHFSVRDNGIGIDPQYFERIFLIFQRLHTRREYSGTGIGLSICKKIIERHRGRIWIESQPGQGSTFHFTIPYKTSLQEPIKPEGNEWTVS